MIIDPKINIESPTAKNVNINRTGFRALERMVNPTVAGNFEVNFCNFLEETLISCCPRNTSSGCNRDACQAGLNPDKNTMSMAITTICVTKDVGRVWSIIGMPMIDSYIETIAGAPNRTPGMTPNTQPMAPMKIGAMT